MKHTIKNPLVLKGHPLDSNIKRRESEFVSKEIAQELAEALHLIIENPKHAKRIAERALKNTEL